MGTVKSVDFTNKNNNYATEGLELPLAVNPGLDFSFKVIIKSSKVKFGDDKMIFKTGEKTIEVTIKFDPTPIVTSKNHNNLTPFKINISPSSFNLSTNNDGFVTVELYSLSGKKVMVLLDNHFLKQNVLFTSTKVQGALTNGTYILNCSNISPMGNTTIQKKILIQD